MTTKSSRPPEYLPFHLQYRMKRSEEATLSQFYTPVKSKLRLILKVNVTKANIKPDIDGL